MDVLAGLDMSNPEETAMHVPEQRSRHAERVQSWRDRTGRTRTVRVDLAALGALLAGATDHERDRIERHLGSDVAARARQLHADLSEADGGAVR